MSAEFAVSAAPAEMLRPGAVVEAVDEGLLFSGWQGSTLMVCKPGVAKVWRAVEPAVRGGFEAGALRARLPEAARGVCDVLVATLRDNGMLVPAAEEERAERYLAYSAVDPGAAAARLAGVVVEVRGAGEQVAAVVATLAECGVRTPDAAGAETDRWPVYVGDGAAFSDLSAHCGFVVAAVAVGQTIVVAPCEGGADRLHAAVERLVSGGAPSPLTWAIARTVLIECLHRVFAGRSRPEYGFLVDASGSVEVPLAPMRRRPSPATPVTAAWRSRDDSAMSTRLEPVTADRIGAFPAPSPGMLVQHPLARQSVGDVQGAGVDQARAGADAVLGYLRAQVGGCGEHAVAGDGPADLLADAVGRLAVAEAPEPEGGWVPGTPVSRRWAQAVTRLAGRAPVVATTRSRGAAVARASVAGFGRGEVAESVVTGVAGATVAGSGPEGATDSAVTGAAGAEPAASAPESGADHAAAGESQRISWGYGADAETAAEHALRGLLKALVADIPTGPRTIVASHESTAALPLLAAALGIPEDRTPPLEPLLRTVGVRLFDLGGGLADTGILVGTVGGR